jgi:ferric-dicitrate binding protein FerR (iron transport regulator)
MSNPRAIRCFGLLGRAGAGSDLQRRRIQAMDGTACRDWLAELVHSAAAKARERPILEHSEAARSALSSITRKRSPPRQSRSTFTGAAGVLAALIFGANVELLCDCATT